MARRLSAREVGEEDSEGALGAVRDVVDVDVDAPTAGGGGRGALKPLVKRLTGWYLAYLAQQVDDLGHALLRAGETLSARATRVEGRVSELARAVEDLEARVRALEDSKAGGQGAEHGL